MGKLMEAYLAKYGESKNAASNDVEELLASIGSAESSDEVQKMAAVYEQLGRRLAREAWAAESVNGYEKIASELSPEEFQKGAAEMLREMLNPEKAAGDEFDQLFGIKTAEDDELKKAAQVELLSGIIKKAYDGNEAALKIWNRLVKVAKGTVDPVTGLLIGPANPSLRERIVAALKRVAEQVQGGLASLKARLIAGAKGLGARTQAAAHRVVGEPGTLTRAVRKRQAIAAGAGALGGALGTYLATRKRD